MGRGRQPKGSSRIAQSDEARRLLKGDTPDAVKLALRLALRGGRQERRRCLGCGKVGVHCKVWSSPEVWQVESRGNEGLRVYWLCQPCDDAYAASGLPPEVERKLHG
jgi:hypothetical protein